MQSASELGIITHDPARENAIYDLRAEAPGASSPLASWLDAKQLAVEKANTSVATIGFIIDLAAVYEEAGLTQSAFEAYTTALTALWVSPASS